MSAIKADRKEKPAGKSADKAKARVPVVGIGASAGGLEAFELFFRHAPANLGKAFVLMPHLAPNYKSMLAEILQRVTTMPVVEVRDQMTVEPNHVYVPPPNHDMQIFHDTLQLSRLDEVRGLRMPIDIFLRSLAEDQQEMATGIVLSGTGSDGTLGLRAIHGAGGITLVQDPASAKFDGMPRSAISAGFVTHVLPPEEMPMALALGIANPQKKPRDPTTLVSESGLPHILMLLRSATGHDFSLYKKSTILRRIERRMLKNLISRTEVYLNFLRNNPSEVDALFKELLINVTSFFRDTEAFALLQQEVLQRLCIDKPDHYVFRVWIPGCATGEEAYSIAMLLSELMEASDRRFRVQIYATDLDEDAVSFARAGLYPVNIVQDLSAERLERFFVAEAGGHYRVKKEIRQLVVFAVQNVIKDPPFTRLDLLSCRNLMIYLEPELQKRLIPMFHYALKPGGALFLSPAESLGSHGDLFVPINRKWKLYRAQQTSAPTQAMLTNYTGRTVPKEDKMPEPIVNVARESRLPQLTRRLLVQCFAPASVLTDLKGEILYVHGETGKYLRPAPGQASLNVIEMARGELKTDLRVAVRTAASKGLPLQKQLVQVGHAEETSMVELSVRLLPDPDTGQDYLLISFAEMDETGAQPTAMEGLDAGETARVTELERELAFLKERHQISLEEEQAAGEALQAANEELQSTIEELQSTNEELETSTEELQSVNEELLTVNTELQIKVEELTGMQNDMKNLLDNINVGLIFLDRHLMVRSFTREATRFYPLAPSDVGRSLNDIKSAVEKHDLVGKARQVLGTLIPWESEIELDGQFWYLVRIQPYRTMDNMIEGVLITFADITVQVRAVADQQAFALAQGIVDSVREPLLVLDGDLRVVTASAAFYRIFGSTPEETLQRPLYALGDGQWDIPALRKLLEGVVSTDQPFENHVVEHYFPVIGHRRMLLNARRFIGKVQTPKMILLAVEVGS